VVRKNLRIIFHCTMPQLSNAAQRSLGLRNLKEADRIVENLLQTIPSDAIQSVWCHSERDSDEYTVALHNSTSDQNGEPTSEPSDPAEFQKAVKALQDLILSEPEALGSTG
jgi:hypothetical protein